MTLHERLAAARTRLVQAGIEPDEAAIDVDVLARRVLGWDRARLLTELASPVPHPFEAPFADLLARRQRREPTAYIVGEREFWGRAFAVTPDVLIPRPDTELIVETLVDLYRCGVTAPSPRVADIGTGSGCLAVTIACEVPTSRVVATDISPGALAVAQANAARHGVSERIDCVQTTYLHGVTDTFDIVVSNPPYVAEVERGSLAPEVLREPPTALFSGPDGLRDLAAILDAMATSLKRGGWLMVEFGFGQEAGILALVAARPHLRLDHVRSDLRGIPRTAIIERV